MDDQEPIFSDIREVPGRGVCGIRQMLYTHGIFYGIDETGYKGRYCFPKYEGAKNSLEQWDGKSDPPGLWIKHNGSETYYNPDWQRMMELLRK